MTTYNTGNPIGSADPKDLYDNAENLDTAVNSSADTFQDRRGKNRLTWAGIVRAGTGDAGVIVPIVQQAVQDVVDGVDGQVDVAQSAANRAEAARDAATSAVTQSGLGIYSREALGIAGTVSDEVFWVLPNLTDNIEDLTLFKNNNGSSELIYVQVDFSKFMIAEGETW